MSCVQGYTRWCFKVKYKHVRDISWLSSNFISRARIHNGKGTKRKIEPRNRVNDCFRQSFSQLSELRTYVVDTQRSGEKQESGKLSMCAYSMEAFSAPELSI